MQKSNEPLTTLASYRRVKVGLVLLLEFSNMYFIFLMHHCSKINISKQGKILFGILLKYAGIDGEQQQGGDSWLHVGQDIHPD